MLRNCYTQFLAAQEYLGIGGGTGEPAKDTETFDELFFNLSELENLGKGSAGLSANSEEEISASLPLICISSSD